MHKQAPMGGVKYMEWDRNVSANNRFTNITHSHLSWHRLPFSHFASPPVGGIIGPSVRPDCPSIGCSIWSNRTGGSLAHAASLSPWFAESTCKCYRNAIKLQSWQIGLTWTHFTATLRPSYLSATPASTLPWAFTQTFVCEYIYACSYLSLTVGF